MFTRNILTNLKEWRYCPNRKPLILRGARQVGKTTVVNEFGKSFDNYLYLNLEEASNAKIFELDLPVDDLLAMLFARTGKEKAKGDTLLFIDEIQNSPKAMAKLRYFYESRPDLFVIAAGSLLENLVDVNVSFPVGRVQYMALRPCSFFEFLGALGKADLQYAVTHEPNLSVAFHDELIWQFNSYSIVGGMPEAVRRYVESHDLLAVDDVYETLIQAYKDDVEKYVRGNKLTDVVRFVLSYGWSFAGQTVTLGNFANSGYRSREVGEAFRLLEKAMLTELSYPVSSPCLPLVPEMRRAPKLLWFDTGLVNYQAGVRKEIIGSVDMVDSWRGHIAEQVTAQELLTTDTRVGVHRHFWARPNNGAEVDFVLQHNSKLYPIEVKSGVNAHLRSLHVFVDASDVNCAVRVWSKPFSTDEIVTSSGKKFKLINLPFYLIGQIHPILDEFAS